MADAVGGACYMTGFKDHFSGHAQDYRLYRPRYPEALFRWLAETAPDCDLAVDVGCGNGQAAGRLAKYFERVWASDPSAQQIDHAETVEGVAYHVSAAESIDLGDNCVSLVCAAQAAHWFDLPRFFDEVQRVLKPAGVVALWCYELLHVNPECDERLLHFYRHTLAGHWPEERALVENGYASIDFPFQQMEVPAFEMRCRWSLDQLINYLGTWSAVRRYRSARGHDPCRGVRLSLLEVWPTESVDVRFPLKFRVGVSSVH